MKRFIEFISEQEVQTLPITFENIVNAPYGKGLFDTKGHIIYKNGEFKKLEKNKWHWVSNRGHVIGSYVTNKELFDLLDGNEKFIIS